MSLGARCRPACSSELHRPRSIVAQSPALSNGLYAYLAAIQNAATNTKSTTMAVRRVRICANYKRAQFNLDLATQLHAITSLGERKRRNRSHQ